MSLKVGIIDRGNCNLHSIIRAVRWLGFEYELFSDGNSVSKYSRIIMPGVGDFGTVMSKMNELGLTEAIQSYAQYGGKLFGICLGMQLLFEESEESPGNGLCIIPGKVKLLKVDNAKLPHVGWNSVTASDSKVARKILGDNVGYAYFVHSYHCVPDDYKTIIGTTEYGGSKFCSVVKSGNILGMQYHPELSSDWGLNLIKYFLTMF